MNFILVKLITMESSLKVILEFQKKEITEENEGLKEVTALVNSIDQINPQFIQKLFLLQ